MENKSVTNDLQRKEPFHSKHFLILHIRKKRNKTHAKPLSQIFFSLLKTIIIHVILNYIELTQTFFTPPKKSHRMIKLYAERKWEREREYWINTWKCPTNYQGLYELIAFLQLNDARWAESMSDTVSLIHAQFQAIMATVLNCMPTFLHFSKNEMKMKWAGGRAKRYKKKRSYANQSKSAKHSRVKH